MKVYPELFCKVLNNVLAEWFSMKVYPESFCKMLNNVLAECFSMKVYQESFCKVLNNVLVHCERNNIGFFTFLWLDPMTWTDSKIFFLYCGWSATESTITEACYWPVVPAAEDDGWWRVWSSRWMLGRGNWNSLRKSAPVLFCPQIPCDHSRVDAVGSPLSCMRPNNNFCRYYCIGVWGRVAVIWKKEIKALKSYEPFFDIFFLLSKE
jgi:hypothetical protein